jgi:hypothetical protein
MDAAPRPESASARITFVLIIAHLPVMRNDRDKNLGTTIHRGKGSCLFIR